MERTYLRFYQKLTIAGSLLCIVFFGLSAVEEQIVREWRQYQRQFRQILISQAGNDEELENAQAFSVEIRQVILDDFDRVDRCVSCHNGIDNPRMAGQPQPHSAHSGSYLQDHPVEKFGCTICHGGQGRALSVSEAFAWTSDMHWEYPVIPVRYVQSSCGRCHGSLFQGDNPLEGAEVLQRGQEIFLREGCLACHKVRGTGGATGLELTDAGRKTVPEYSFATVPGDHTKINWLRQHFLDPQTVSAGSIMPKITLEEEAMNDLITFTMSLYEPDLPAEYYAIEFLKDIKGDRAMLGGEQTFALFCARCHGAQGAGNNFWEFERFVPALNNPEFLATASDDMIRFTIRHGRGGIYMSAWGADKGGLQDAEIDNLVALIRNWQQPAPTWQAVQSARSFQPLGRTLFRSRCGICHGSSGEGGIGPSLNTQEFLSLASDRFLYDTITKGRANTAMVSWSMLTATQVASIIEHLRSFQTVPQIALHNRPISGDRENGEVQFAGLCAPCHGRHGQGAVGPALFNADFLAAASDDFILRSITRGRNNSAMRSFAKEFQGLEQLTDQELRDIVVYIRSQQDVTTDVIHTNISPGTPSKGQPLYLGMCAPCHGPSGEGKHGPSLNNQGFLNAATNGFLQATIALGRSGTAMRSWAKGAQGLEELTTDEINDIVAFIRTWQTTVIPKN